jgi:ABC-type Mn2+/Zn2+ transport system permease subunit
MANALSFAFVQKALIAGAISSILLAVLGVYVVLKKMSFIGDGIAHSAFGGVALGLLLGVNTSITAMIFAWVVAMIIGISKRAGKTSEDALIGIFFAFSMALGIIFIGFSKTYNADLLSYLFGDILAVTGSDILTIGITAVIVLSGVFAFYKELLFFSFDEEGARVSGIPVDFIYFLLLTLITVTVVASIKIVGIILVAAFLIAPASAALLIANDFKKVLIFSVIIGLVSTLVGFFFSYVFDLASGASMVVTVTFVYLACLVISKVRGRK